MATDGYIYLLNQDNTIVKLDQGKKVNDFSLKNSPQPNAQIKQAKKIVTAETTASLFIIDAGLNRIMEYDKEGYYKKQYWVSQNVGTITDLVIQPQLQKLFILAGNKVYAISH